LIEELGSKVERFRGKIAVTVAEFDTVFYDTGIIRKFGK
jgi:hypothetical protein